jgi:hypothetical protein
MSIIQFKMSNDDELICEVIEEPAEEDVMMVVRNALQILTHDDPQNNVRMYSFRPWMTYQDKEDFLQLLNVNHILGEAKPSEAMIHQYKHALQNEQSHSKVEDDEINERREQIHQAIRSILNDSDQPNNIISFDRSKLH